MEHPVGRNKAIAFNNYLEYNQDNKEDLIRDVRENLKRYKCSARPETVHGVPFEVAMILKGPNGKYAKVKTGWIIDKGGNTPRLTTIYVDD